MLIQTGILQARLPSNSTNSAGNEPRDEGNTGIIGTFVSGLILPDRETD